MLTRPKASLGVLLLTCILFTGCDKLLAFKGSFAASKPLVQSLVPSVLTQAQADGATADIQSGVDAATKGETCLKTGTQTKAAKAQCYLAVASDLRVILERHNLGGNKWLDAIANIAQAAIAGFEAYNASVSGGASLMRSSAGADRSAKAADADKELENTLKNLTRQMKQVNKELKAQAVPR